MSMRKRAAKAAGKARKTAQPAPPAISQRISGAEFAAFQEATGMNDRQVAAALGLGKNTPPTYRDSGASLTVALACAALAAGLGPYNAGNEQRIRRAAAVIKALDEAE